MYREHFGLVTSPFGISPRLDFLYRSAAFEESMAHLVYGLENSEAIVMITGAIGTGKTMAIQSFLSHLGDRYLAALVTNTSVDAKELLKLVLDDLEVGYPAGADKSDLLIAFKQFLIASGRDGKRIIIVIDESQNLQREVLEEIRLLTNLGQGEEQPVQIVLVGQPELETAVLRPDLAQLRQRIRVHYKLTPLSRKELDEYVDHRMAVAGGQAGTFTAAALDRVFALSGGVPRVVNTLCGDALLSAFVAGRRRVEAADVSEPAAGWESAPAPARDPDTPATGVPRGSAPEMAVRRESPPAPRKAEADPRPAPEAPVAGPRRRGHGTDRGREDRAGPRVMAVLLPVLVVAVALALYMTGKWEDLLGRRAEEAPAVVVTPPAALAEPAAGGAPDTSGSRAAATDTTPSPVVGTPASTPAGSEPAADAIPAAAVTREVPVQVEPAKTVPVRQTDTQEVATEDWFIHVSSFRTPEQARAAADGFITGGNATVIREQVISETLWHRVYLGPFATHDVAVHRANELRDAGAITYYKVLRLEAGAGS